MALKCVTRYHGWNSEFPPLSSQAPKLGSGAVYPASLLKRMVFGFVFYLGMTLASHVLAAGDDTTWRIISTTSGLVRYTTHGTVVYGHEFGFVKKPKRCEVDELWLSLSTTDVRIKQLIGSEVAFLIDVDGIEFKIRANLWHAGKYHPLSGLIIAYFGNYIADPEYIELFKIGKNIEIRIIGSAKKFFDLPFDEFSLVGFAAARREALNSCRELMGVTIHDKIAGYPFFSYLRYIFFNGPS